MVVNNKFIGNINRIPGSQVVPTAEKPAVSQGSFDKILQDKVREASKVKFSRHAEMRLQARNIRLSQAQTDKLRDAVGKAESKGIKDTLVLVDGIAFVVNIRNRTVVTAVNSSELKDNVFTNIDGAVFT